MATVEELQAQLTELKESLKAQEESNKGLKADLTKAKAELRKGQEIDPTEFANLQAENEALKTKYTALDKDHKKVLGERDNLAKTLETESKITVEMQRDTDLTNALTSLNVTNPISLKAAKAMLAAQVQVVTENDKRLSKVGDKPLSDYLKDWAATDEGKHFISANQNNGGNAQGNTNTNSNTKTMTRSAFDQLSPADKQKFSVEKGTLIDG